MKRQYAPGYRQECLSQVRAALAEHQSREAAVVAVAAAMGVPVTTLRTWVRTEFGPARSDTPSDPELSTGVLQRELERLRRANLALSRLVNADPGDPDVTALP